MKAWKFDHTYDELKGFPFSGDVLHFDNEWWADSDDEDEFGPSHFRDLVAVASGSRNQQLFHQDGDYSLLSLFP